jgi:hypothetical protein
VERAWWAGTGQLDAARAGSDRRLAHRLAADLGAALPGAATIDSLETLRVHLAAGGADAGSGAWVVKALHTAAGRDRVFGQGGTLPAPAAAAVARLLVRSPVLVFEPWCARLADFGCIATALPPGAGGRSFPAGVAGPHRLLSDERGGFVGIQVDDAGGPAGLEPAWRDSLMASTRAAGLALAALGYRGPFGVDAFAWRDPGGTVRFHPLCEINPRLTFGWVARAWSERLGGGPLTLQLGRRPPASARLLLGPGEGDPTQAWITDG